MAIIYTSRDLPGTYSGYTNTNWGFLMNSYAVRFTPGAGGQGGGAFEGVTHYFGVSVYFPNSGNYTVRASADNFGSLSVAGQSCAVSGLASDSSTTLYINRGTHTVSGSVYNSFHGPSYATNPYGIAFTIDAPPPPPAPTVSISASPSAIIRGNCVTLTYSSSGVNLSSASLTDVSDPGFSGSATVCPNSTRSYSYEVCGEGGCTTRTATVTVYIPPVVTLSLNKTSIIAGQCTTLSWYTTGDADTIQWISGSIDNLNLTSNTTVCPADTTTYTAKVSGTGGEDTDSITIVVNQVPTLSFTLPDTINYGDSLSFSYESQYSNTLLGYTVSYVYTDDTTFLADEIDLPNPSSSELNGTNTYVSGTTTANISYNDFGPKFIDIVVTAAGGGGQVTRSGRVEVIIDQYPENIIIPETEDVIKNQDPVFTPETEVLSELLLINDIDIPVEIKSNYPIQVDINGQDDWKDVRQIT
jgi:hypothetical protein